MTNNKIEIIRDELLQQVADSFTHNNKNLAAAPEVVTALLEAEKTAKKPKISYSFENLIGTWRLCFVTGVKKKQAGISLGKGRYLPQFIKIFLSYSQTGESSQNRGRVKNCVNLGLLKLSLTGPVKFLIPKNLLVFDFTRMNLQLLGFTVYDGYIRSGEEKETSFYTDKISKQAFFAYFYLTDSAIAARGRGGGLALWSRVAKNTKSN